MGTQRFLDGSLEVHPGTRMKHPTTSNFLLDLQKRLCYSFVKVTWRRSQVRSEEASFP